MLGRCVLEINPAVCVLHQPVDAVPIRLLRRDRRGEFAEGGACLPECAGAGGDPGVQFRHHHLQRQVQGFQATAGLLPTLPAGAGGQQLQHRSVQAVPKGTAESGLLRGDGGEGRSGDHHLSALAAEQIEDSGLDGRVPQAAHPDQTRPKATLPQGLIQVLRKSGVPGL